MVSEQLSIRLAWTVQQFVEVKRKYVMLNLIVYWKSICSIMKIMELEQIMLIYRNVYFSYTNSFQIMCNTRSWMVLFGLLNGSA